MKIEKRFADEEEWYLLQELESFGIDAKRLSELKDKEELRNLVENIKQTLYQEYKTHYSSSIPVFKSAKIACYFY